MSSEIDCWPVFLDLIRNFPSDPAIVDPENVLHKYNSFFMKHSLLSRFELRKRWIYDSLRCSWVEAQSMYCDPHLEDQKSFQGEAGLKLIAAFYNPRAEHRKDLGLHFGVENYGKHLHSNIVSLNSIFFDCGIDCHVTLSRNSMSTFFVSGSKVVAEINF